MKILMSFCFISKVPHTVQAFALDISVKQGRNKVREEFAKNRNITDLRVVDMLVIKVTSYMQYSSFLPY